MKVTRSHLSLALAEARDRLANHLQQTPASHLIGCRERHHHAPDLHS
jgi:hypothetical protein